MSTPNTETDMEEIEAKLADAEALAQNPNKALASTEGSADSTEKENMDEVLPSTSNATAALATNIAIKLEPGLEDGDTSDSRIMAPPTQAVKKKSLNSKVGPDTEVPYYLRDGMWTEAPDGFRYRVDLSQGEAKAIDKTNQETIQKLIDETEDIPEVVHQVTCVAPVNIAVIKYWGKRNEKLILPTNDSISGTLNMNQMRAKTTIAAASTFKKDIFWLNGVKVSMEGDRMQNVIRAMKKLAAEKNTGSMVHEYRLHIASENNFPTAAGLASSAAGFACLVYTLAQLYGIQDQDLTPLARLGSGSACRSLYGGFVHWKKGESPTGEDSVAEQLADVHHWPEMRVVIVVVADSAKKVPSSSGMRCTVQTSDLFQQRIGKCVDERIKEMKAAIANKDFPRFAKLTMRDSNQFHAVCLDTYPPIRYLNDTSHKIMDLVHKYNDFKKATKVAYTFDAGPNACLYMLKKDVTPFISMLNLAFPSDKAHSPEYIRGAPVKYMPYPPKGLFNIADADINPPNQLRYIIYTSLGNGPNILKDTDQDKTSLLTPHGELIPLMPITIPKRRPNMLLRVVPQKFETPNKKHDPRETVDRVGPSDIVIKTEPIEPEMEGVETTDSQPNCNYDERLLEQFSEEKHTDDHPAATRVLDLAAALVLSNKNEFCPKRGEPTTEFFSGIDGDLQNAKDPQPELMSTDDPNTQPKDDDTTGSIEPRIAAIRVDRTDDEEGAPHLATHVFSGNTATEIMAADDTTQPELHEFADVNGQPLN